jgi:CRISPR/Cas system-associated protein Cas5 (RAMP superfamily)
MPLNSFQKMSQFCFICRKPLTKSRSVVVDRGIKTLIDSSVARNYGFFEYLKDQKSVTIHVECRKMYTRNSSIAAVKRQNEMEQASTSKISPPRTRARVSESYFCFKKYCLFCDLQANEESEKKKAQNVLRKIYKVATLAFKESILKVARARSDDAAKTVTARIEYDYDLVAAEAKYHNNCYNSFLIPTTERKSVVLKINLLI